MDKHKKELIAKLQRQLRLWEQKAADLKRAPGRATRAGARQYAAYLQELSDRLESVRIKLEKLRRVSEPRFGAARAEIDQALRALQTAWDAAVAKISWSDPLGRRG